MHADTFPLRALLRTAVAILALAFATLAQAADRDTGDTSIRPFRIDIPQAQLDDLQRRLKHTRWPDKETVADASQGAQLARVQALVEHWRTRYDWRRTEARLNAYPQFVTAIDGVDIHFLHIRSPHADALPLIMTHGWPGSVIELLEVIGPLTNTTGDLPALPGRQQQFDSCRSAASSPLVEKGWEPDARPLPSPLAGEGRG
jgi:hypothetical protein